MSKGTERENQLGLTLLGNWRDCPAIQGAFDRGSMVFEEQELSEHIGRSPEQLENWLIEHWLEHNIKATMEGREEVSENNMTATFQRFSPREHFAVRLFSPRQPDSEMVQGLRFVVSRPQVM